MNVLGMAKKRSNDYQNGYSKGFEQGVKAAILINLYQVIQFLGDKRGWKRESIFDALQWLHKHAEMILEDYTTFSDVRQAVEEEYGIVEKDGIFYMLSAAEWELRKQGL